MTSWEESQVPEERWPPTPIRMKSTRRRVNFKRGYGYVGTHSPERDDHVKMLFKNASEYEHFILSEAERIRGRDRQGDSSGEAAG